MTAANHALTGAFIGLTVGNPWVAIPVAFVSHFVLDVIPHFDVPGRTTEDRIKSKAFLYIQIMGGFAFCVLIVSVLAVLHPTHWLQAALCAFVATTPDLAAMPRYIQLKRTGRDMRNRWWFWRLHHDIQWFQEPIGAVVEIAWLLGIVMLILPFLNR